MGSVFLWHFLLVWHTYTKEQPLNCVIYEFMSRHPIETQVSNSERLLLTKSRSVVWNIPGVRAYVANCDMRSFLIKAFIFSRWLLVPSSNWPEWRNQVPVQKGRHMLQNSAKFARVFSFLPLMMMITSSMFSQRISDWSLRVVLSNLADVMIARSPTWLAPVIFEYTCSYF